MVIFLRPFRAAMIAAATLVVPYFLVAQTPGPIRNSIKGTDTAEQVANILWKSAVTTCTVKPTTDKVKPEVSAFYMESTLGLRLIEYRNPWTQVLTDTDLTHADRLNGIQWRGRAVMGADVYRSIRYDQHKHGWSAWFDMANSKDSILSSIASGTKGGVVTIWMEKRNNQWLYSSVGPLSLESGDQFDPDAAAARKVTCDSALKQDPFRTAEDDAQKYICPGDHVIVASFCKPTNSCRNLAEFRNVESAQFLPGDNVLVLRKAEITGIDTNFGYVFQLKSMPDSVYRLADGSPHLACSTPDLPAPPRYVCAGATLIPVHCGSLSESCNLAEMDDNVRINMGDPARVQIKQTTRVSNRKIIRSREFFNIEGDDRVLTFYSGLTRTSCPETTAIGRPRQ